MFLQPTILETCILLCLANGVSSLPRSASSNYSATLTKPFHSTISTSYTKPHSSISSSSHYRDDCHILQPPARNQPTNNVPFSFSIPYNTQQSCNIYGPTCQTGSITVDVCKSGPTVLPCSSYLSSQAQYLRAFDSGNTRSDAQFLPIDWQRSFGRSPECRAYKKVWVEKGEFSFPGCPNQPSQTNGSIPLEIPPGYPPAATYLKENIYDKVGIQCCGDCGLRVPRVHIFYFPDANASSYCQANGRQLGFAGPAIKSQILPNYVPLQHAVNVPTIVTSGITMISPSVYMKVEGTMSVHDGCGVVSPTAVDPIYAFDPGELSTFVLPTTSTASLGYLTVMDNLKVADLECPSMGLAKVDIGTTTEWGIDYSYELGPPWLPLIAPPSKILDSNPEWKSGCPGVASRGYARYVGMYDPPSVLVPAENLVDPKLTQPEPTPAAQYSRVQDPAEPVLENPSLPVATPVSSYDDLAPPNINSDPSLDLGQGEANHLPVPVQPSSPQPGSKPDIPAVEAPKHQPEIPFDLPNFFPAPGHSSSNLVDKGPDIAEKPAPKSDYSSLHDSDPHLGHDPSPPRPDNTIIESPKKPTSNADQSSPHVQPDPHLGHDLSPPERPVSNTDQSSSHVQQPHKPDPRLGHDPQNPSDKPSKAEHVDDNTNFPAIPNFFDSPADVSKDTFIPDEHSSGDDTLKLPNFFNSPAEDSAGNPIPDEHIKDDADRLPNFFGTPKDTSTGKSSPAEHSNDKSSSSSTAGKGPSGSDATLRLPNFSPDTDSEADDGGAAVDTDTIELPNFFNDPANSSPFKHNDGKSSTPSAAGKRPSGNDEHDDDAAMTLPNFSFDTDSKTDDSGDVADDGSDSEDTSAASSIPTSASPPQGTGTMVTTFTGTEEKAPLATSVSENSNGSDAQTSLWVFDSGGTTVSVVWPAVFFTWLLMAVQMRF